MTETTDESTQNLSENTSENPADKPTPKTVTPKLAPKAAGKKPAFNAFLKNNNFTSPKFGSSARKGQAYKGGGIKKGK